MGMINLNRKLNPIILNNYYIVSLMNRNQTFTKTTNGLQHQKQKQFNDLILLRLDAVQKRLLSRNFQPNNYVQNKDEPSFNKLYETLKVNLQRADKNTRQNLSKLEEHVNGNIEEIYKKVREFQNSILLLIQDKEAVLTDLDYRISTVEQIHQRNQELKQTKENTSLQGINILNDRVNEIEQLQNIKLKNIEGQIKKYAQYNEDHRERFDQIKKQLEELKSQLSKVRQDPVVGDNSEQTEEKLKIMSFEQKEQSRNYVQVKNKIHFLQTNINSNKNQINKLRERLEENEQQQSKKYQHKNEHYPNYGIGRRDFGSKADSEDDRAQLPSTNDMRGGIRGLLQKSKEKDKKQSQKQHFNSLLKKNKNKLLPKQQQFTHEFDTLYKPRGLPPVKPDIRQQGRLQNRSDDSEDLAEYNVDQDGYLIDEDGNYLLDQYGDNIQISEEDLAELMRQQQER